VRDPDVPCHVRPSDSSLVDYAKVREHTFENLILLCANGHARVTAKEIDTLSVKQFKANLSVVMQRCGDLERRVLELFAQNPSAGKIELPGGQGLLLSYLLRDGLLVQLPREGGQVVIMGLPAVELYGLTPAGRDFVNRWVTARDLKQQ